eukprot:2929317-Rhodomonas_salina.2
MTRSPSEHSFSTDSMSSHTACSVEEVQAPASRDESLALTRTVSRVHNTTRTVAPLMKRFHESTAFIRSSSVHFSEEDYCGEGSISFVFKATMNEKTVAAKILRTDTDDLDQDGFPSFSKDFVDELNIVELRLNHPNIMGFIGASTTVFCDAEVPMIVYEYVNGGSVEDLFDRKSKEINRLWKPPSDLSFSWCKQLTEALAHLHNLDTPLAHRDIKPANLLVSKDMQTLKLADFSLAKAISSPVAQDENFTAIPSIAGSLRYMAPEVSQRKACDLAKSDVYSAALTCWSLIHGQRPFSNIIDASVALVLASQGLRPPTKQNQLGTVLAAAWNTDPAARPAADQLAAQFAALEKRKASSWGKKMLSKVTGSFLKRTVSA